MPPTWIFAAENGPIYDEGVAFAKALAECRVEVEHRAFAGLLHNFFEQVAVSETADAEARDYLDRLRAILGAFRIHHAANTAFVR